MATTLSTVAKGKGKEKSVDPSGASSSESESNSSDASATSDSENESEDSSSSESDKEITQEYLDSLLEKARQSAAAAEAERNHSPLEEILTLDSVKQPPLPKLDPGELPASYLQLGEGRGEVGILVRDPEVEKVEMKLVQGRLTKREKKKLKKQTAGPDWFDMPALSEADLPRLHREVEALRLRNQLDPKRFYRKEEAEGKGIEGLPKYFAVGQIVATESPFGGSSADNLPPSQRKRTLLDELIDDAEAQRYAKKKFNELQSIRGAKGKNTLRAKQALRKPKW